MNTSDKLKALDKSYKDLVSYMTPDKNIIGYNNEYHFLTARYQMMYIDLSLDRGVKGIKYDFVDLYSTGGGYISDLVTGLLELYKKGFYATLLDNEAIGISLSKHIDWTHSIWNMVDAISRKDYSEVDRLYISLIKIVANSNKDALYDLTRSYDEPNIISDVDKANVDAMFNKYDKAYQDVLKATDKLSTSDKSSTEVNFLTVNNNTFTGLCQDHSPSLYKLLFVEQEINTGDLEDMYKIYLNYNKLIETVYIEVGYDLEETLIPYMFIRGIISSIKEMQSDNGKHGMAYRLKHIENTIKKKNSKAHSLYLNWLKELDLQYLN